MGNLTIGVDIGGSHIVSAAVDTSAGKILKETQAEEIVNNKGTLEQIMQNWAIALNATLSKIDQTKLNGIGFAMPGPFNYKTGHAMFGGDNEKYEALSDVYLDESLRPLLNLNNTIAFRYLNDATSFAVGEAWLGRAKEYKRSISIALGTGFGSAFIEDGVPVVNRNDVPEHGCFWHLPFKEGIADDYFSTRWFVKEYKKRTGESLDGVKEVAMRASEDNVAKELFETFGVNLGAFLLPWLKQFPADVIVIGGNISGAYNLFSESLNEVFRQNKISVKVETSQLLEDAALIGSARLFEDSFWEKVEPDLPTF